ncbi:hypothetical protein [Flavobacterium subsaxonicum]|nr:hypothetical protein [Flavobacterium subsaxonicum]
MVILLCGSLHAQVEIDSGKTKGLLEEQPIDTIVLGDINNDKIVDTAFVYTPPVLSSYDERGELIYSFGCKENKCYNNVTFSCNMPNLLFDESVWGKVAAVDDIDGDGTKELLFNTSWFIGTSTGLYLYHFNGNEWQEIERVTIRGCINEEGEEQTPVSNYFYKKGKRYYLKGITLRRGDEVPQVKRIKLKELKRNKKSIKN